MLLDQIPPIASQLLHVNMHAGCVTFPGALFAFLTEGIQIMYEVLENLRC